MWYDKSTLLSYNKLFNFCLGPRGDGKSYDMKKWLIKDFKKTGHQGIILRRYETEVESMAKVYFDDIRHEFPEDEIEVKGNKKTGYKIMLNKQVAGFIISLSTTLKFKSVPFPKVNKIIFEEFIIDKGSLRYLTREVDTYLEFYETVSRLRDNVRAFFVANTVSVVNPYFLYWNIKVDTRKRFTVSNHIAVEIIKDNEYTQAKLSTRFGQMMKGTNYGKYAMEGEFLRDNEIFIEKKTPKARFQLGMVYNGVTYGFWVDYQAGYIYVNRDYDPSSPRIYALTKDDHMPNILMIDAIKGYNEIKAILNYFHLGLLRFSDMTVKNQFYEYVKFF